MKLRGVITVSIVVFFSTLSTAQDLNKSKIVKTDHSDLQWYQESMKENPNYQLVNSLYEAYFAEHPYERSIQKNKVRRWLMTANATINDNGLVYKYISTREDFKKLNDANQKAKVYNSRNKKSSSSSRNSSIPPNATWNDSIGSWRMIGPYHSRLLSDTHKMYGGFNDRVFVNRFNANHMIAGQSYGGLWTSHDAGATWALTDGEYPNGKNTYANRDMYYGEIEVHPSDQNRIVVGSDAGLLISTDAGDSWDLADSLNYLDMPNERSYFVAQKNDDTNIILASYGKKIYRTTDGGNTWNVVFDNSSVSHVRSTNQHNTLGVYGRWYNFTGLDFDYSNPNVVYLGALNSANQTVLYKSTDAGLTFTLIANTNKTKWLKMVYCPDEPGSIYFVNIFTSFKTPASDEGIYKFNTSGTLVSFTPYPGNADAALVDDVMKSQTDDVWMVGGYASDNVYVSNDGGSTFVTHNAGSGTGIVNYVHPDIRSFAMVGDTMLIGTDGGLHLSFDGGLNFESGSQWISAIDLWGFSSAYKGELVGSGDDHGPSEIRMCDKDGSWHGIGGADSHELEFNKCDQRFVYGRDVYNPFRGEQIDDSTFVRNTNAIPSAQFKSLAQDPDECYRFYPSLGAELRLSTNNMTTQNLLKSFNNTITKVEVVLKNNQILYVLENQNKVHKSIDGGITWNVITPSSSTTGGKTFITDLETNETGDLVWLSYGQNQSVCKAVMSSDGGATWSNVTGAAMPNHAASQITYQRGTEGVVYISLEPGSVWYRGNSDTDWSMLGADLPYISYITSIYTVPDMGKFRMGTSRGAFEHDLPVQSNALAHFSVSSRNVAACAADTVLFFDYSSYYGESTIAFNWTFEGGTPSTSTEMNPKVVYLEPGIYDVSLTITDGNSNSSSYTREDFMSVTVNESCGPQTIPSYTYSNITQNRYITAPSMDQTNTQNYTMMAWVKGEGSQVNYAGILSHKLSNGSIHLNTKDVGADSTQLGYHHPNGTWQWGSGHYLKPDQWTHIALVVEPSGITIYKNGVPSKHNITVTAADLTEKFVIGTMIGAEWYRTFAGQIDEVAFYKRSLTSDDIRTMMHLTKQNPNYTDQHDTDLIAYYQFNEQNPAIIKDLSGNQRDASFSNNVVFVESNGPFGGGRSEIQNVNAAGLYNYTDPGVKLEFGSIHPSGQVVVTHIENLPDVSPMAMMHEESYYIIDNYGANKVFDPMFSLSFDKSGTVSNEIAINGSGFIIWKRGTNDHEAPFDPVINTNITASAGNQGSIKANDASPITGFSQFVITRDSYIKGNPRVRMVTQDREDMQIAGGESVSLWIDSDHQGLQLPILSDTDIANAGMPQEGVIVFSESLNKVIVFSNGNWKSLKINPISGEPNGTIAGEETITIGSGSTEPSAIVSIKELGFVQYTLMTDLEILTIDYPIEGMMVYNTDQAALQYFNGSNWTNLNANSNTIAISTSPALPLKGIVIGEGVNVDNAVLQDHVIDATIMIPTLNASDIKDPAKGLLIYDEGKRSFLVFDGTRWQQVL